MTDLLERAMATARGLPPERQDEIARVVLALTGEQTATYRLTPDEAAEQDAADAEEARGDYASEDEIHALWARHGLRSSATRRLPRASSIASSKT